ncbi:hypothetical protein VRRI112168_14880 [Vreelandella rituensis]|uniref:Uncharacterized protein n=1 Tax=Vreelandella rituensis TaxID=2282306 RepID=A0A368UDF4_9GAMM|nr:hypothetical protein [Halomonas rituensis]RCV93793.1 hypothetical protein DU506_01150 [Halomonas rituensis]
MSQSASQPKPILVTPELIAFARSFQQTIRYCQLDFAMSVDNTQMPMPANSVYQRTRDWFFHPSQISVLKSLHLPADDTTFFALARREVIVALDVMESVPTETLAGRYVFDFMPCSGSPFFDRQSGDRIT